MTPDHGRTGPRATVRRSTFLCHRHHAWPAFATAAVVLTLLVVPSPTLAGEAAAPPRPAAPGSPAPLAVLPETDLAVSPAPAEDAGSVSAPGPDVPPMVRRKLHPMAADMRAAVEHERTSLAELSRRFRAASSPEAALAVQREIERVKHETELTLLRIQADYARRAGLAGVAARIEAAIEEMTRPAPSRLDPRAPDRPARTTPAGR
jgi:hypothetical protein